MHVEIEALEHNKTWLLVDISPNIKLIGCKWVYLQAQTRPDGSIERHKA